MRITVIARHCDVADELRDRGRAVLDRLEKRARRAQGAQVIFSEAHGMCRVELRLGDARSGAHLASADAADHRTALDRAAARLRRQFDKAVPKRRRTGARTAQ
ncbi:MAG TPA: HPF/RaiA family ribosome-associated protein [Gemmatimonadales bacterium]|nr:HPF/RaiA family ribosome-associated protein [Gemmatimonadales bacterium]